MWIEKVAVMDVSLSLSNVVIADPDLDQNDLVLAMVVRREVDRLWRPSAALNKAREEFAEACEWLKGHQE